MQDEFETSHWPCERCLEALKTIKVFWNILLEKLFHVNVSKASCFKDKDDCSNDSSREVARNWQKEMMQQAIFVKAIATPQRPSSSLNIDNCTRNIRPLFRGNRVNFAQKCNRVHSCHYELFNCQESDCSCHLSKEGKIAKQCRYVSANVKTVSVACNTCDNAVSTTKLKNENLAQQTEMAKLVNENLLLKRELQKVYDEGKWRESSYCPKLLPVSENPCSLLHAFEESALSDDTSKVAKNAESEMIITLRNCKNDVSIFKLLQIFKLVECVHVETF